MSIFTFATVSAATTYVTDYGDYMYTSQRVWLHKYDIMIDKARFTLVYRPAGFYIYHVSFEYYTNDNRPLIFRMMCMYKIHPADGFQYPFSGWMSLDLPSSNPTVHSEYFTGVDYPDIDPNLDYWFYVEISMLLPNGEPLNVHSKTPEIWLYA